MAASINHPRCVFVFGAEQFDGFPAIAMELMPGGTLQDRIERRGPIPFREAVDMILDVIEGLEAAQRAGVLHRDVKPSNCFVDQNDRCQIGDFGISKSLELASDLTKTGIFVGTPAYASPEQLRGREADLQSDIYSVGATLYALLAGKARFHGVPAGELLARILSEEPAPFSRPSVEVPKGLERVILRALAKDRSRRFSSYAELRRALLPFSSNGLTAGSLVRRVVAYQIDRWMLNLLGLAAATLNTVLATGSFQTFALCLYLTATEAFWGRSLGKYLLGLQVRTAEGTSPPLVRVLIRNGVWAAVRVAAVVFVWYQAFGFFTNIVVVIWELLPFLTIRYGNQFAGIHEILSGTRVMTLRSREALELPAASLQPSLESNEPTARGPYTIAGTLWRSGDDALFVGRDELLLRPVWIHEYPAAVAKPVESLTAARPGRLRWLQGSREGALHWDAFEAPQGISFCEWASTRGALSWAEMRNILRDVTEELDSWGEDDRRDATLSATEVWIDALGTARLLGFTAPSSNRQSLDRFRRFSGADWSSFIKELTVLGLSGQVFSEGENSEESSAFIEELSASLLSGRVDDGAESSEESSAVIEELSASSPPGLAPGEGEDSLETLAPSRPKAWPGRPVPEHARSIVEGIFGQPGFTSPGALVHALRRTAQRPARLTAGRRLGPTAAIGAPVVFMSLVLALVSLWLPRISSVAPWLNAYLNATRSQLQLRRTLDRAGSADNDETEAFRKIMAYGYLQASVQFDGRQAMSSLPPRVRKDLEEAARRYPNVSEAEAAEALQLYQDAVPPLSLPFWSILSSLASVYGGMAGLFGIAGSVFGTGPLFRLFGMAIQTADGHKASRLRCLLRATIAWSPFVFLALLVWILRASAEPVVLFFISAILLLAIFDNARTPECGIPDILAGTRIVPA